MLTLKIETEKDKVALTKERDLEKTTYMGSVGRFDAVPEMTYLQKEAIAEIHSVSKELRFDTRFKRGDMQFCNNHVIFHTRIAYEDDIASLKKRHLLKILFESPRWTSIARIQVFMDLSLLALPQELQTSGNVQWQIKL